MITRQELDAAIAHAQAAEDRPALEAAEALVDACLRANYDGTHAVAVDLSAPMTGLTDRVLDKLAARYSAADTGFSAKWSREGGWVTLTLTPVSATPAAQRRVAPLRPHEAESVPYQPYRPRDPEIHRPDVAPEAMPYCPWPRRDMTRWVIANPYRLRFTATS